MKFYTDKVKEIRKQQKVSQDELSEKMNINRRTIGAWEAGLRVPSESKIRMLARILEVSVDKISDLEPDAPISTVNYNDAIKSWLSFDGSNINKQKDEISLLVSGINHIKKRLDDTKLIIDALGSAVLTIIYIKDVNLNYVMVTPSFLENISFKPGYSVLNKTDHDFFNPREAKINEEEDIEIIRSGKNVIYREGYIPGSRRKKWGLISKILIYDSDKKIAGLVGSFIDITKRKKAEETEKILRMCTDSISQGLMLHDIDKIKLVYMNKTMENFIKLTHEEMNSLPNPVDFFLNNVVHPDDRENERKYFEEKKWPEKRILRISRSGEKNRILEVTTTVIQYSDKNYRLLTAKDIS